MAGLEDFVEGFRNDFLFWWFYNPRQESWASHFNQAQESLSVAKSILMYGNDQQFAQNHLTLRIMDDFLSRKGYLCAIVPEIEKAPLDLLAAHHKFTKLYLTHNPITQGFFLLDDRSVVLWDREISSNYSAEYNTGVIYRQFVESKFLNRQLSRFFHHQLKKC